MTDPTDEEQEREEDDGDEPVPEPVTLVVDDAYLGSHTNL